MIKVSVIIPSWNRITELKKCLENVYKQDYKDFEVIVIDNNSTDGSKEMIKKEFKKTLLVPLKENVGAARARNIGINLAKGEFLWFLDSDAYPAKKTCLKDMVKIMENNPQIGELGGEIIDGKIRIPIPSRNHDGYFIFINKCRLKEVASLNTSNCILRKSMIKELGGFDPEYFYGFEDIEISEKIKKQGYKIIIDDRVLAYHTQIKKSRVSTLFIWQRNRIRLVILKEKTYFIIILPLIDIYTLIKLAPKKINALKKLDVISFEKNQGIIKNLFLFILGILNGYFWNITNISKTLKIKRKNPNFLNYEIKR